MTTIELNGVTLILTEETAEEIRAELNREREEQKRHWILWHWYARRFAMYGSNDPEGMLFSDMYKDENGCRPHMSREDILWILYGRECWIEHGPYCKEYKRARARNWR